MVVRRDVYYRLTHGTMQSLCAVDEMGIVAIHKCRDQIKCIIAACQKGYVFTHTLVCCSVCWQEMSRAKKQISN